MGGRPQKREKASGRKGWELGSTWNVKWIHVGMGSRGTLERWPYGTGLWFYGFTLGGFTVLRWDAVPIGWWNGLTLRGC